MTNAAARRPSRRVSWRKPARCATVSSFFRSWSPGSMISSRRGGVSLLRRAANRLKPPSIAESITAPWADQDPSNRRRRAPDLPSSRLVPGQRGSAWLAEASGNRRSGHAERTPAGCRSARVSRGARSTDGSSGSADGAWSTPRNGLACRRPPDRAGVPWTGCDEAMTVWMMLVDVLSGRERPAP